MISDTFEFNGKQYIIKRDVSFGEFRKITRLQESMKLEDDKSNERALSFTQIMVDFLETMLGLNQNEIDSMSLNDAGELFGKAFFTSTQVKKKLETTSELQSLQETPKIQP